MGNDGPRSYRCSMCAINHPPESPWDTECCGCGGHTDAMAHANPNVTTAEARSRRNHRKFEQYLEESGRA